MTNYQILILIVSCSAFFAYINQRFIKMPFVIGLFLLSTLLSLSILSVRFWHYEFFLQIKTLVARVDISKYILEYMLGYLLFAGSLHTDWKEIQKHIKTITILSVFGVLLSTFIIGGLLSLLASLFSLPVPLIYCLLFGALMSPTDPIAVLGILTKANVPKKIESIIVGESLFNDGVGVVVFLSLLETLHSGTLHFNVLSSSIIFIQESVGGIAFGLAAGYLLHKILTSIDHFETEVLLTLAFVMVGYSFCLQFDISGALAMVVMGLFVGNYNYEQTMSDTTIVYVEKFWELIDIILNAILFVIISFVLVVVEFKSGYILFAIGAVVIVLFSRVAVIFIPKTILPKIISFDRKETGLMIWGGLRGGLSIALVLSLPNSEQRNILLIATYTCVVFSILVQGLTIEKLALKK
jgi:CPA1 family monovalent cation:H+ antiporter